jgi:hypothetical protein
MKLKSIITTVFFIGAFVTGTALAGGEKGDQAFIEGQDETVRFYKADKLKDQSLVSQEGEELGSIDNVVISEDGEVFIALSRTDNGDMVLIPWEAANLQKGEDDKLTASITTQELEGAPTFEEYAEIASPEYEQEVHGYFGADSVDTPFDVFRRGAPLETPESN